jgi:hypothetical protein
MKMTLSEAIACADRMISTGGGCAGCPAYAVCGIDDQNRQALADFLDAVDPQGLNITTIGLGALGAPPEDGDLTENARRANIRLGVF